MATATHCIRRLPCHCTRHQKGWVYNVVSLRMSCCNRYANGLVYAFASLILGYCVDHLNWPRTWLLVAANLLLAGMYVLEVSKLCWHASAFPEVAECVLQVCLAVLAAMHASAPLVQRHLFAFSIHQCAVMPSIGDLSRFSRRPFQGT